MHASLDTSPLADPSYLLSSAETIADSLHEHSSTSVHDLLDAYATFVNRVRSHSMLLAACDALPPAILPLEHHKDSFVRALRRDVRFAHIDPLSTLSRPRHSFDDILLGSSIHLSIRADAKQYARDSSSLCHHALCVLATIFRFPAFHLVFPKHDLSILFHDVLDITLADQLPVLNEAKTYSLSLWTLGSHRLPATILDSRRDDLFSTLQRSLDGARQPDNVILDGLKAISHTIEHYPSIFLNLLSPLLPHVTTKLHCKSSELRLHAAIALGRFAIALIRQTELSLMQWQTLSNNITSHLEACCNGSQVAPRDTSFSRIVRAAFPPESYARPRVAPTWILAVLASLIVLCGPTLYRTPTALRFVFQTLSMTLAHERSVIRALHPHVWRCLVWTFSQMLLSSENVEPALISSALYAIKQEVRGGIGVTIANILLSNQVSVIRPDERGDRVFQALSVIKTMVRTECKHTRREAFMFLRALTNDTQARHQISRNVYETPASVLFNGAIAGAGWDSLPMIIHSIPKVPVSVHWLEETEIVRHHKTLLSIWKQFATTIDREDVDSGLVEAWLSILLACAHQLECGQHTTVTIDVLRHAAAIAVEFLPSVALRDCQPDWGSWDVHDQLFSLKIIERLWSAMRKAFLAFSLAEAAEFILASILKYTFHVLDLGVRTLWGRLCASLMTTAPSSFLSDIYDVTASQLIIRGRRELWADIASSLSSSELSLGWEELVRFLAIPICTWTLSKSELDAWEALLRDAIAASGDSAIVTGHLVLQHLQGKEVATWESIVAMLGLLLTCTCEHGNSPTDELLSLVNVCLIVSYTRARQSSEVLANSLELLDAIRHVIVSAPSKIMHILQALCSGLRLWIEDHNEVMSNDEFNSVAVSLYCETLEVLQVLPLSVQSLRDMEDFLTSAFSRIPTPAIAPFAFEKFWRATYHGHSQFYDILPRKIKSCLACFVAAYGGDLAGGLSLATGSQSPNHGNGSQPCSSVGYRRQNSVKSSFRASPSSAAMNAEGRAEAFDTKVGHQQVFPGQDDTTFLVPSSGGGALQPTIPRQLQERTSRMDTFSPDGLERPTSNPRALLSSIFPPTSATQGSQSPGKNNFVTSRMLHRKQKRKRKLGGDDNALQKRSRTPRNTLRSVRESEPEPSGRKPARIDVLRMKSVPPRKRRVFDGVHLPTLRESLRQKMVQRAKMNMDISNSGQGPILSIPQTPSSCSASRKRRTPLPTLHSDEDNVDTKPNLVDATSEGVDVARSLVDFYPSSPPQTQTPVLHSAPGDVNERPPSAPFRPSLRRAKTTPARLDAPQDVYSPTACGTSRTLIPGLVQATKLVRQIGAVLTEQIGNKVGDSG